MATVAQMRQWFTAGKWKAAAAGFTHMVVCHDEVSNQDYVAFVEPGTDAKTVAERYDNKKRVQLLQVFKLNTLTVDEQIIPGQRVLNY